MNLRNEHIGVYIGITNDNNFYEATTEVLTVAIPSVNWSYASPDLLYAKSTKQDIWWVGWTESKKAVNVDALVARVKSTIDELSKGALDGEIGSNH